MPTKKKASKKEASKKEASKKETSKKPEMVLRHIDSTTIQLSDNSRFPEYKPGNKENIGKGMKRVDATTIVKE